MKLSTIGISITSLSLLFLASCANYERMCMNAGGTMEKMNVASCPTIDDDGSTFAVPINSRGFMSVWSSPQCTGAISPSAYGLQPITQLHRVLEANRQVRVPGALHLLRRPTRLPKPLA